MRVQHTSLVEALALGQGGELVSIVGGGGKSALLFSLAGLLSGRVVLTTTTRIFANQIGRAAEVCAEDSGQLEAALERGVSGLLVLGEVEGEKAMGVSPELPGTLLAHPRVDFVLVEADGSRMRPIKAPAGHEPVIPEDTSLVVVVVGIDALQGPIREIAHRPELVSGLTGRSLDSLLDPASIGVLLSHPSGGLKGAPQAARIIVMVNKIESPEAREQARAIAEVALAGGRVERVVAGALEGTAGDDWTVYERDIQ